MKWRYEKHEVKDNALQWILSTVEPPRKGGCGGTVLLLVERLPLSQRFPFFSLINLKEHFPPILTFTH